MCEVLSNVIVSKTVYVVDDLDGEMIDLPGFLWDAANIPKNAKLCASVDAKEGTVLIGQADYAYDLRDQQG